VKNMAVFGLQWATVLVLLKLDAVGLAWAKVTKNTCRAVVAIQCLLYLRFPKFANSTRTRVRWWDYNNYIHYSPPGLVTQVIRLRHAQLVLCCPVRVLLGKTVVQTVVAARRRVVWSGAITVDRLAYWRGQPTRLTIMEPWEENVN
jgi:hypothetical protein